MNTVAQDSNGRVWVGTSRGLQQVDLDRLEVRDVKEAQSRGGVLSIHEDTDGRIWLGTMTGGLQRLQMGSDRMIAKAASKTQTPIVVTSFAQDPSGKVFVGTLENGILVQEPLGEMLSCESIPIPPMPLAKTQ